MGLLTEPALGWEDDGGSQEFQSQQVTNLTLANQLFHQRFKRQRPGLTKNIQATLRWRRIHELARQKQVKAQATAQILATRKAERIPPFKESWAAGARKLLPQPGMRHTPQAEEFQNIIEANLIEVRQDYMEAAHQHAKGFAGQGSSSASAAASMKSPCPVKLGPANSETISGDEGSLRMPSKNIGVTYFKARAEMALGLQVLSPQVQELHAIWQTLGLSEKLIMGLRDPDFKRQLPLDLETFQNWQMDECERAKQLLWGTWAPRTLELFRRTPPRPANGDLSAFWRCMCTLQGRHLRGLLERSIAALVDFYQQHANPLPFDNRQGNVDWAHPAAFSIDLVFREGEGRLGFRPRLEDVEMAAMAGLDVTVTSVSGIPKAGSTDGAMLQAQAARGGGSTIPVPNAGDPLVHTARSAIQAVFEANRAAPTALISLLEGHSARLNADEAGGGCHQRGLLGDHALGVVSVGQGCEQNRPGFPAQVSEAIAGGGLDAAQRALSWPAKMSILIRESNIRLTSKYKECEESLKQRRKDFMEGLGTLQVEIEKLMARSELHKRDEVCTGATALSARMQQANATATGINTEERLLGWAATKFPQLATFTSQLTPLVELWGLAVGFFDTQLAWLNAPLPTLNSVIIGQEVTSCDERLTELEKAFIPTGACPSESAQRVSLEVRAKTDQWASLQKLLAALADPSLQERHWVAIAEAVGFEVRPDESTTLRRLIEYGIQDNIAAIIQISEQAQAGAEAAAGLKEMQDYWSARSFSGLIEGDGYEGLTAASDGSLAALSAQAAEHLGRTVQLKEAAGTPRIFAGFASLQTGLEAIQTLLEQLMHVNVAKAEVAREIASHHDQVTASQAWEAAQARLNGMECMLKVAQDTETLGLLQQCIFRSADGR
ncbi:hypothetical protein WJX84_003927 [Apatococcus fuscideae]|uniref:Dynein heavy chain linker domain-containing protein n=1 Tax=Apatococcus fuscideae TaxID=2026836 RepID=A0AAW1S5V1_9CHLO